jgi:UDP-N-acetylmuramate dehydrogenase
LEVCGKNIGCEAGLLLSKIANAALKNGLGGMEFASGIPGTIGGAVVMNAGAYGREMKDIVAETECINQEGKLLKIKGNEHQFGYRTSIFQKKDYIVLSTVLKLNSSEKADILSIMSDLNKKRREKQPIDMPSAGSVFKRPVGYYAGKLIEDCGLRSHSIGGATISEKHCGFIINNGSATSKDVIELIRYVQETVERKYGIKLETEVKTIGEG